MSTALIAATDHAAPRHLRHGVAGAARPGRGARRCRASPRWRRCRAGSRPISCGADLVVEHVDERAIGAGAAGGVLAFAPADEPVVGLDAQDRGIEGRHLAEIAAVLARGFDRDAHPPGLDAS